MHIAPISLTTGKQTYMWDLYIPRPDLAIIYCPGHILCFQLPDFSVLSPSDHIVMDTPTWYLPGLLHDGQRVGGARIQFAEPIYDPSVADCFSLYLMHGTESRDGMGIVAGTIVPPTSLTTPPSSQPHPATNPLPLEKRVRTQSLLNMPSYRNGWEVLGESNRDGFHFWVCKTERGSELHMSSYEDMVRCGEKGMLRVFIPEEEMGSSSSDLFATMIDEASGRVLIWRWDSVYNMRRVYIWDLV